MHNVGTNLLVIGLFNLEYSLSIYGGLLIKLNIVMKLNFSLSTSQSKDTEILDLLTIHV